MISSILIDALARRAHTVALNACGGDCPSIERFRDEFNAELARFAITPDQSSAPASPSKRAALLPSSQPSLGSGLGQSTGGTAESDSAEAKRILGMISDIDAEVIHAVCGQKAEVFVTEMQHRRANGGVICVTGRQLFFLRDIHSQLIEKGYV